MSDLGNVGVVQQHSKVEDFKTTTPEVPPQSVLSQGSKPATSGGTTSHGCVS